MSLIRGGQSIEHLRTIFVPYTGATADVDLGSRALITTTVKADGSGGLLLENSTGGDVLLVGAGGGVNATAYGGWNFDSATANTIAGFGASKTLVTLSTTVYPNLTELSYLKGVTSSVQDQLNSKAPSSAVDNLVPYTGAVTSVDLGNQSLYSVAQLGLYDPTFAGNAYISVDSNIFSFINYSSAPADIKINTARLYDNTNASHGNITLDANQYTFNDYANFPATINVAEIRPYDQNAFGYGTIQLNNGAYFLLDAGGGTAHIYAGIGNFDEGLNVSTISGLFLNTDFNNNRLGIGLGVPQSTVHQHIASASANYLQITNSTTSSGAADGFRVGISSTGVAEIRQYENSDVQFYTNNTLRFTITTAQFTGTLPFRGQDGTAAAPAYSFSADTNTGIYRSAADTMNFAVNGTNVLGIQTSSVSSSVRYLNIDGSAASPSYSFGTGLNMGMYRIGTNILGVSTASTERQRWDASGNTVIGGTTASARLHAISTTEQLRIGYDASNYYSTTVGISGGVTFNAVGTGAAFAFSDKVSDITADTTTAVTNYQTIAGSSYSELDWQPAASTTGVRFAQVAYARHSTANSITGVGHLGGVLGYATKSNATGTDELLIGVEGRVGATTGAVTTAAAVTATFDTNTENAGTIAVGIGFYLPTQADDGHITSKFFAFNPNANYITRTAGIIETSNGDQQVIPRDRAAVVTGRYYPQAGITALFANTVITRNVMWAVPFVCPTKTTWTKMGATVGTAVASSVLRFGIYKDVNGVPSTLILDAGTVSSATIGEKEVTISQSLDAGIYWLVVAMQGGASDGNITWASVNSWETMGMTSATAQDGTYFIAAAGALPSSFGTGTYGGGGFAPHIWMRK